MSELKYNSDVVLKSRKKGKTIFGSAVADDLLSEIKDLRAQLEAKYEEIENDVIARMIYSKDKTENKFIQRAIKAEQERDNLQTILDAMEKSMIEKQEQLNTYVKLNTDLQAANGVLRDGLKNLLLEFPLCICDKCNGKGEYEDFVGCGWGFGIVTCKKCEGTGKINNNVHNLIESLLSTTPAEAGERVKALVEATEQVIKVSKQQGAVLSMACGLGYIMPQVYDALAKFRGGAE